MKTLNRNPTETTSPQTKMRGPVQESSLLTYLTSTDLTEVAALLYRRQNARGPWRGMEAGVGHCSTFGGHCSINDADWGNPGRREIRQCEWMKEGIWADS
jgi:hypothetical protein